MNRKRCVFCLVLFTVLFSPALAKAEPSPASLEALFQSFQAAAPPPTGDLTMPAPFSANHCNAQQNCPNQCIVSCTGHTSCTVQSTSVTCDGVTTNCPFPTCTPPESCLIQDTGCSWCACKAAGSGPCFGHCLP
jgi:hypothetical protein